MKSTSDKKRKGEKKNQAQNGEKTTAFSNASEPLPYHIPPTAYITTDGKRRYTLDEKRRI